MDAGVKIAGASAGSAECRRLLAAGFHRLLVTAEPVTQAAADQAVAAALAAARAGLFTLS